MTAHRVYSFADLCGRDFVLAQADERAQRQNVGKVEGSAGGNEILLLPALKLPVGDVPDLKAALEHAKGQLRKQIDGQRQRETQEDRARSGRFE